ncbi:MAG: hypothetical protein DMD91_26365 [Candidatus Rokuibacteriota bacterium]|nr:MAG: hypothetical protein DMD91_26365 [Candidatus Rokubacteria bacterium]
MLRKCTLTLLLLLVSLMLAPPFGAGVALADEGDRSPGPVRLLATVPTPGVPLVRFDISWVDQDTQLYYLADRSNAVIDVVDAKRSTFVKQIPGGFKGFTGNNDTSGPNGVVTSGRWLFVTDAPSRVVSIDLKTRAGALTRPRVLAFAPMNWRMTRRTGSSSWSTTPTPLRSRP